MNYFFSIIAIVVSTVCFGQLNMNLLGNLNYQTLHNAELNDIWGYVDETGKEYALVGTTKGTSVVDLSDPTNPTEIFWEPGLESIWRDLKTFGDYAYVTTEAANGLLIIDLSPLPASNVLTTTYYTGDIPGTMLSAHNLYIDVPSGRAFIFGSNFGNGGVQILDVQTNPMIPSQIGSFDTWYVHDGVVRNDTMYLAHINNGFLSLVDISTLSAPVVLGTKNTPNVFAHNIWPSDNGQFVYTTDEVSGAYVTAYDISNPANIIEVDRIQSSPGAGVIPHNTHVKGDFLVTSYYSDGVTIHDATYPYNLIEIGHFDTYPQQTRSYDGCWGAYPWLPSGNMLATDRATGLWVLGANYQQAAYLEGIVTDASTLSQLSGVVITVSGTNYTNQSNGSGFYATGTVNAGNVSVTYQKVGYYPQTIAVSLVNGVIVNQNVQLIPIPPYNFQITVIDALTSLPISDAYVRVDGQFLTHDGATNGLGEEDLTMYYEETYLVSAGKWGYKTKCTNMFIDNATVSITVQLEKGYYDDFSFDFGWVTGGTSLTGNWTRAIPFGTQENANPNLDDSYDCGKYAYVTGNLNDFNFTLDDVENGEVKLFSPIMDLTTYATPFVNYSRWFYDRYGPSGTPNDSIRVYLSNGTQTVLIDIAGESSFNDEWIRKSILISDYISITSTMQLIVQTSDYDPDWSVVEAGLDWFYISEYNTTSIKEQTKQAFSIYPNPSSSVITIQDAPYGEKFTLFDLKGQLVNEGMIETKSQIIDISHLQNGIYLLKINEEMKRILKN